VYRAEGNNEQLFKQLGTFCRCAPMPPPLPRRCHTKAVHHTVCI
jgi:hypothetical protein